MTPENGKKVTSYRVAVPKWKPGNDLAYMIGHELQLLEHEPVYFSYDAPVPDDVDILLTFGPSNKILPLWQRAAQLGQNHRPVTVHWNTEGIPDLRIPPMIMRAIGAIRSRIGRMSHSSSALVQRLSALPPLSWIDRSLIRYRYVGDYEYAYRKGWLHVLSDSSQIYSQIRTKNGLPTLYAPWGASKLWYRDLGLKRDIDVLWMGKRGTPRRSRILDQVVEELSSNGVKMHIADNEQNPFIFGETRIEYLNRAKITLNITRTWYDDNFSRFALAAPNRSLMVSEPLLPHCYEFEKNVHYVSAEITDLAKTILYYLEHEEERQKIVENAYHLLTNKLLFCKIIKRMIDAAIQYRATPAFMSLDGNERRKVSTPLLLGNNRPYED